MTNKELKQLEWEASDDEDAPEVVTKALVRKLLSDRQKATSMLRWWLESGRSHPQLERQTEEWLGNPPQGTK